MKTYFLLFAVSLFVFSSVAQTTSVCMSNEQWDRVDQLENQSLPQSALELVNQIQKDAIRDGNSPELIKSLIYQLKYETAIDRDQLPNKIVELEQWIRSNKNQVEQAILYSIVAELYANYYNANTYRINQRTTITGYIPDDIREWSANLFIRQIADYVRLSLLPVKELQKTDVLDYRAIVMEGEASRTLRPTLYDFLVCRGIELLKPLCANSQAQNIFPQTRLSDKENFAPVDDFVRRSAPANDYDLVPQTIELYRNLLDFRLKENNSEALVIADLDRLEFVYRNSQLENVDNLYWEALQQLENRYANNDFCVEILFKKASFLFDRRSNEFSKFTYGNFYRNKLTPEDSILLIDDLRQIDAICSEGIRQYPQYKRIEILRNLLQSITGNSLRSNADNVVYPGNSLDMNLHYRNAEKLYIRIYKMNEPVLFYGDRILKWVGQYDKNGELVQTREIDLKNDLPYLFYDTIVKIPIKEPGNYEYIIHTNSIYSWINRQFSVSRLASVTRGHDGQQEFLITDRLSGKPLEGATIHFYRRKNDTLELIPGKTAVTDHLGLAVCPAGNGLFYKASYENDTALILSPTPWVSTSNQQNRATNLQLFTDRSIYRPGQTVYLKGIAYEINKDETQALPNKTYTISLRDANDKEVANRRLTTNAFGSFSGEFQLPHGLLNGVFTLRSDSDHAGISIRVEEYKRPTFDIRFTENDKIFHWGDSVTIEGKAKTFSGIAIPNNGLHYRITRQPHWLYRWGWSAPIQVAEGVIQTGGDGSFAITFVAERAFDDRNRKNVFYTYVLEASITDANGETQQSQTNVNIGDSSGYLVINRLEDVMDKETFASFTIYAMNLDRNPVQAKGVYEIYSLKPKHPAELDAPADAWIPDKKMASGDFEAGKEVNIESFKSFASGRYRMIANVDDLIEKQTDFSLASSRDKQPPIPVYEWLMAPKTTCAVGENAEIIYGSSTTNVHVLYEIFQQNKKRSTVSRFILNNENRKLTIPFLEDYGDGITVCFTFIKDSRVFTKRVAVYKKRPDKNLALKMEVFRDRLLPGQKEEWKISVKDADKNPVLAELLAVMYDASLDKIANHTWQFYPVPWVDLSVPYFDRGREFERTYDLGNIRSDFWRVPLLFDQLNWFGWSIYNRALPGGERVILHEQVVQEGKKEELHEPSSVRLRLFEDFPPTQPEVQIRQNFNETAFFYPQLKTNEAGESLISFTVPESNTTWKLMGLAHTKDMKFGQVIEKIISQKQLMIRPNIPRFLREGDRVTISTNISNLSENGIDGIVQIECFDPETGQTKIAIPENSQPFHLEAGKTTSVSWTFQTPSGMDLTALKILASSPEFSDGEQHLIPILPNRMLVTESLPLAIQGGKTKTCTFDGMTTDSPGRENYRLTLEFTANPIGYAVQALPAMTTPESDNALSWFAAYYSNALAAHIANSTPKIKSLIDSWTKQGGTNETLLSQLEKNQELKAVLLEETPWMLEAQNETEQRQRLALLFDINRNNYLNDQAIEKLRSFQTEEGGWTWFKEMPANVSITQWILYGMGELSRFNMEKYTDETRQMQAQAIRFIDERFKHHYEDYRKNHPGQKPKTISTYELEYLFVRSMYKDIPLNETNEAFQFYLEITGKFWDKNTRLYDRAIAAMVLQRNGNTKTALSIVKSLREHASHKTDEGMFWANNQAKTFLFQSATCVHTFMMQAFYETGSKPEEMDEMKRWLLTQKQTQKWESVPATVNAVNILLQTGTNCLDGEGKVSIRIGNQTLDTEKGEVGTGYFRTVFDAKAITPDMNRITVSKEGAGPGWGAVYGQYFEDLDKIKTANTGLNVEKSLFIEKITATGKSLLPVTENQSVKVGDKVIVRLVVRADRDFEYLLLKDMRASCFEPAESLSRIRRAQQAIYYQMIRDASMNFYFYNLPQGTYVFEYPLYANASGDYSNGIATIQCLYAPEFVSHTSGGRVTVE